ncbi:MAG: FAD-binding protein, partial [Hymenobacter sp.]
MKQELDLALAPEVAYDELARYEAILAAAGLRPGEADFVHIRKRSLDARGRRPLIRLRADVYDRA